LVCKDAFFSIDDIASTLPASVTNLLQQFRDVFRLSYLQDFLPFVGLSTRLI
jgi:AraC-like DNA-binding protein